MNHIITYSYSGICKNHEQNKHDTVHANINIEREPFEPIRCSKILQILSKRIRSQIKLLFFMATNILQVIRKSKFFFDFFNFSFISSKIMSIFVEILQGIIMDICIFYSWQSKYKECCDNIIQKALDLATQELNDTQSEFVYRVLRGGGDTVNSQEISSKIDYELKYEANIIVSDFTNVFEIPESQTGKFKAHINSNVCYETGKAEAYLGNKGQVIKVYP